MIKLTLPNGQIVVDGAVLILGDNIMYALHHGKYKCASTYRTGWYVQAFTNLVAIPVTDELLENVTVVNTGQDITLPGESSISHSSNCACRPKPKTVPFTDVDAYLLSRAWITVDTKAELDSLPIELFMTGRIVEVNNVDEGDPQYYRYNYVLKKFEPVEFVHSELAAKLDEIAESMTAISKRVDELSDKQDTDKSDILESIDNLVEDVNVLQGRVDNMITEGDING